jgi:lipopolysaccharide heptosyltransferase I
MTLTMRRKPAEILTSSSPRIVLLRLSAIGDVIHGLPVLCALREAFPSAHLAWVVEERAAPLLKGHRALDQLIVLPRGWPKSMRHIKRAHDHIRAARFDLAIDIQGLSKSSLLAFISGIPLRIGFGGQDGREVSRWLNNRLIQPAKRHVVDRNLELLRLLGVEHPTVRFDVPVDDDADRSIEDRLHESNLPRNFAIINPGAGWPSKLWPSEWFGRLAAWLGREAGLPSVVVWGGPQERDMADTVVAHSQEYATRFSETSLPELAALCRRAALVVASDTGPLHISAAVGAPTVGLFGPVPAWRNGPYGANCIAVQKVIPRKLPRGRRRHEDAAMRAIEVRDVIAACEALLFRHVRMAV